MQYVVEVVQSFGEVVVGLSLNVDDDVEEFDFLKWDGCVYVCIGVCNGYFYLLCFNDVLEFVFDWFLVFYGDEVDCVI